MTASTATLTRVVVVGPSQPIYNEADAAELITPGRIVEQNSSGGLRRCRRVGRVPVMVAIEDTLHASLGSGQTGSAGTLNDDWAIGSRVVYQHLRAGCEFMGLVAAAGAAIVYDDPVECDGDGGIRLASAGTTTPATTATLTTGSGNGALTFTARDAGDGGNGITIQIAAAGTGGVVVNGNDIVITPDTGANTATAVVAQVAANAAANSLVVAVAGGSGAAAPGVVGATHLAGGTDAIPDASDGFGRARLAVDNSGGSSPARIRVAVN